jgi:hypothetical protein
MQRTVFAYLLVGAALPLIAVAGIAGAHRVHSTDRQGLAPMQDQDSKQPVVVELFTSEGCSSCPPADALLKLLSQQQPVAGAEIVALEEHVDYWNQLGWVDPFSSRDFSARQQDYATAFRNSGVYTPQMVVDGATEFVGSHRDDADAAIRRAAARRKIKVAISQTSDSGKSPANFEIALHEIPSALRRENLQLWVAVTESGLATNVTAGENSGEKLQHADVVRSLQKIGGFQGGQSDAATEVSVQLKAAWKLPNLRVVAFVVDKVSHRIVGAASVSPRS